MVGICPAGSANSLQFDFCHTHRSRGLSGGSRYREEDDGLCFSRLEPAVGLPLLSEAEGFDSPPSSPRPPLLLRRIRLLPSYRYFLPSPSSCSANLLSFLLFDFSTSADLRGWKDREGYGYPVQNSNCFEGPFYAGLLGLQSSCLWMKISFSLWAISVSDVGNDHLPVLILIRTFYIYILWSVMQTVQTFKDNLLSYFVVF